MKKPTKRLLVCTLAAILIGFALLNILAYNHAHAMMYFTSGGTRTEKPEKLTFAQRIRVLLMGVNVPRPVSTRQPSDLDPGCRRLAIRGTNGITLGCWYVDRGEKTPLVILFHGYGAEKTGMLREAKVFLQLGMSVLLVDFRGSGESSETYTTIGFREADDVTMVLQHARFNLHHPSVVLYGQSMGAVSILRSIRQGGLEPDGVILEAVFDTMLNTVRNRFQAMGVPSFPSAELLVFWGGVLTGFNAFDHNPVAYAKSLTCPVLFMHGTDARTGITSTQVAYFGTADVPSITATMDLGGHPLTLVATHPLPPGGAEYSRLRNEQLDCVASYVSTNNGPLILLGDLNITPWSPIYRDFIRRSGLVNSSQGRAIHPSWPSFSPLFLIPIDHCLHNTGIAIKSERVGKSVGSDHLPLIVEFGLKEKTQ